MKYKKIDPNQSDEIAKLALCLTEEIIERTTVRHFDIVVPRAIELCTDYISRGIYQVIAALDDDTIVGFGTLCESHSLYAEGAFGILQEFYVLPQYRSQGVGKSLLEAILQQATYNGWKRLELCTPPVPEFDRTVAFYRANGFEITGGYKMKRLLV